MDAPVIPVYAPDAVAQAAAALRAGGAVVLPTDTVYGLAALAGNEHVLSALKARPPAMPIAVLVADADQGWTLAVELPERSPARLLAERLWPGPLTIVVHRRGGGTVGLRCPDHDFVRALAAEVGPLPTTSANRHGEPTPPSASDAAAGLDGAPALVIDGGRCEGLASTVVDATGDAVSIVRLGALSSEAISAVLT